MTGSNERKAQADRILYGYGLYEKLSEIGTVHIIGSYRMDMMAWNDLDIDLDNRAMSAEKLYELTDFILRTFHPCWYEAKEEVTAEGKRVWFHGFETRITGELWNIDLWFFDQETIDRAEQYCDHIKEHADAEQKAAIMQIKRELIRRGLYAFDQYKSMDVYQAVLENRVMNTEEFLQLYE